MTNASTIHRLGVRAPVLILPDLFEPALCAALIAAYDAAGGEMSGFMVVEDGRTVGRHDPAHKVRRDHVVSDPAMIATIQSRIVARVVPAIRACHHFPVTRMERYLVACYDAAEGGHFRAHRDNTTPGTAHRRFALSINLNGDFEGGALRFPEFSDDRFTAPPGAGIVFSCSLLHQVDPVTRGRRYAFLPFLYDEAAAELRRRNQAAEVAGLR
ncbi:2OG-Fe(II) oxygenase [Paracoccus bogoriensis]|uniref:2OG-Fe(II) oxygenase n=1 Tax=Paracoccus bogoriensis TaxID=242065 RepID=UPI001C66E80E|nr:2OG-Fe(II) oxygenase [Paracoccus bogoriensis]MBW7056282.1 2OG-Fe(II) oxygenase [Paracoccus bogoriensis]